MGENKLLESLSKRIVEKWSGEILAWIIAGSNSYGLSTKDSDVDIRAIHSVHPDFLLGLFSLSSKAATLEAEEDNTEIVSHELGKFLQLCMKGNPSVVELLFTPEENIIKSSDIFDKLREPKIRNSFLCEKHIMDSYLGYSKSQLMRMTNQIVNDENKMKSENIKFSDAKTIDEFISNNPYLNSVYEYNHKLATHCLRLLISLNDFVISGKLSVHMEENVGWLMQCKNGDYSYGRFMSDVSYLLDRINKNKTSSKIPKDNSPEVIDEILISFRKGMIK